MNVALAIYMYIFLLIFYPLVIDVWLQHTKQLWSLNVTLWLCLLLWDLVLL